VDPSQYAMLYVPCPTRPSTVNVKKLKDTCL